MNRKGRCYFCAESHRICRVTQERVGSSLFKSRTQAVVYIILSPVSFPFNKTKYLFTAFYWKSLTEGSLWFNIVNGNRKNRGKCFRIKFALWHARINFSKLVIVITKTAARMQDACKFGICCWKKTLSWNVKSKEYYFAVLLDGSWNVILWRQCEVRRLKSVWASHTTQISDKTLCQRCARNAHFNSKCTRKEY